MKLTFDADQLALRESTRGFLQREFRDTTLHHDTYDAFESHRRVAPMELSGLAVPAEAGGSGAGLVELCVVAEEFGACAVPTMTLDSFALATSVLLRRSDGAVAREWLPGLVDGAKIGTLASLGADDQDEWLSTPLVLEPSIAEGWTLSGSRTLVPSGQHADLALVPVALNEGFALVAVPTERDGVKVRAQRDLTDAPVAALAFERVAVGRADIVAEGESLLELVELPLATAVLVGGAHAIGACEAALSLAVDHARSRHQFGRPIGGYQSVANRCADMRVAIDGARLALLEAAWLMDRGDPQALTLVSSVKVTLNRTCRLVADQAHQVHGAIGYSTEYPLHRFSRFVKRFETTLGSSRRHADLMFERDLMLFE